MNKEQLFCIYKTRFQQTPNSKQSSKNGIWKILCKYFFQKFIKSTDVVCDIGAGYCEFINNINCKTKIAFDLNPNTKNYADKNVIVINDKLANIQKSLQSYKINLFFMSNFLNI